MNNITYQIKKLTLAVSLLSLAGCTKGVSEKNVYINKQEFQKKVDEYKDELRLNIDNNNDISHFSHKYNYYLHIGWRDQAYFNQALKSILLEERMKLQHIRRRQIEEGEIKESILAAGYIRSHKGAKQHIPNDILKLIVGFYYSYDMMKWDCKYCKYYFSGNITNRGTVASSMFLNNILDTNYDKKYQVIEYLLCSNYINPYNLFVSYNPLPSRVKLLEENYLDYNKIDNFDVSPLMLSAYKGNEQRVRFFISKGADINLQNSKGWTALMTAAYWKKDKIVKYLICMGADINIQNEEGDTAEMIARKEGNTSILEILQHHSC